MPITNEGLKVGLTAGVRIYNTQELGWTPNQSNIKDALFIVCSSNTYMMGANPDEPRDERGNGVLQAVTLGEDVKFGSAGFSNGDGTPSGKIFTEPEIVAGTPNKVKSYLSGSCVLPIAATGTVQTILFFLGSDIDNHPDNNTEQIFLFRAHSWGVGNNVLNEDLLPSQDTSSNTFGFGDMFMGIEVSPGIPVTAGGFLTIKGYDGTNENSKSFTYVTLESSV